MHLSELQVEERGSRRILEAIGGNSGRGEEEGCLEEEEEGGRRKGREGGRGVRRKKKREKVE